jgi:PIN domain nuclease of toxin-antitoxin system
MSSVVVDTHAGIWYFTDPKRLSPAAKQAIDGATSNGQPFYLPSISLVEMRYLVDKGKIAGAVLDRIHAALELPDTNLQIATLDVTVARAVEKIPRGVVPDMPDRIIAATALSLQLPLVSRDRKIQASAIQTIW